MREALSALTARGRAFLAAGVTAIVCAILLGQRRRWSGSACCWSLLPLVTACFAGPQPLPARRWCARSPRSWSPPASRRRCSSTLTNEGRTPTGVLLLEDQVPYVLGTRPRFVVEGIGHGWHRTVTYQVRSDVRGQLRDRPDDGAGHRPVRPGRARPHVPRPPSR